MFSGHVMCKGIWQVISNQKEYWDGLEILNFIFEAKDNRSYSALSMCNMEEIYDHILPKCKK